MKTNILQNIKMPAFRFVCMIGIVNLFANMTYEGGAAINGQFLGELGASAAAISLVAGMGEFFGYIIRSIAGYFNDKIGKPWLFAFIGYSINLLAVPAMALVYHWQFAAALIFIERIGRAIRKPTVDSMLSYTTMKMGSGMVYGLNTALAKVGAVIAPMFIAGILFFTNNYRIAFAFLLIPTFFAIITLALTEKQFEKPEKLETGSKPAATLKGFTQSYWIYMLAGTFFASGLMSYELIAYHLSKLHIISIGWIPVFLGFSTIFAIIASLVFGKYYDKMGLSVVLLAVILSSLFAPLIFLGGFWGLLLGMCVWGVGYSTQDSLLKAIIANHLPRGKRSLAFGLFYTAYGSGWLIGSAIMGLLYEHSKMLMIIFAMTMQLLSLPLFILARYKDLKKRDT